MIAKMGSTRGITRTGGRQATTAHIPGDFALAVGMPRTPLAPDGWKWVALSDVARMESGHTPSRKHPEYWGGDIPWIGIRDAKNHHGQFINDTEQHTNELGIQHSSARLLPPNTVCLSRTASVGYVVVTGRSMATSQDFVNWICSDRLCPQFLKFLLLAEKDALLRFGTGAVHKTIYYPLAKAFHICLPPLAEQKRIVAILDEAFAAIDAATANTQKTLTNAREFLESHLNALFAKNAADWDTADLKAIANIQYGYTASASADAVGPRFLRITDIQDNRVHWGEVPHCEIERDARAKYQLAAGDIVFARTGATTGKSYLVIDPPDAVFASYLIRVRSESEKLVPEFLYLFFQTSAYWSRIRQGVSGSAQGGFNATKLGRISIPTPSMDDQRRLVAEVDALQQVSDKLATLYARKLTLLAELKQSILHRAFTGELTEAIVEQEMETVA